MFDVYRYLARIQYDEALSVSHSCLAALHRHHVFAVPFEATDIHFNRPILLGRNAVFDKVVTRQRGGFCYELNYLFAELLRALGFPVTMISASVYNEEVPGPPFDHLAILVDMESNYLVDVGFGDLFHEPLRLIPDAVQADGNKDFRIEQTSPSGYLLLASLAGAGTFTPQYTFGTQARRIEDFHPQCAHKQRSPDSYFVRNFICTRPTEEGRKTIKNGIYTVLQGREKTERTISGEAELLALLASEFGLNDY